MLKIHVLKNYFSHISKNSAKEYSLLLEDRSNDRDWLTCEENHACKELTPAVFLLMSLDKAE
jgi:hypothetical protein